MCCHIKKTIAKNKAVENKKSFLSFEYTFNNCKKTHRTVIFSI